MTAITDPWGAMARPPISTNKVTPADPADYPAVVEFAAEPGSKLWMLVIDLITAHQEETAAAALVGATAEAIERTKRDGMIDPQRLVAARRKADELRGELADHHLTLQVTQARTQAALWQVEAAERQIRHHVVQINERDGLLRVIAAQGGDPDSMLNSTRFSRVTDLENAIRREQAAIVALLGHYPPTPEAS